MNIFKTDKHLAKYVKDLGGKLYLVGGAVRDNLMGRTCSDKDYVVTGLSVEDMDFQQVGKDFPVFLVDIDGAKCEVVLARIERKIGNNHTDFVCETKDVTIEKDLSRRDFTINAIAYDILKDTYIDPFNGQDDINNHVLRHTSEAFEEDPLRVYRAARFSATLGFKINVTTLLVMESMKDTLSHLSPERIWKELHKVLQDSNNPRIFFDVLIECNLLDVHFKHIANLDVPDMHDGTALEHTLNLLDKSKDPYVRFGLLSHDLGKGISPKDNHPHHYRHDRLGIELVEDMCSKLRIPNDYKHIGMAASKEHMKIKCITQMSHKGRQYKYVMSLHKNFDRLMEISLIDSIHREGVMNREIVESCFNDKYVYFIKSVADVVTSHITGTKLIAEGYEEGVKLGELLLQRRIRGYMDLLKTMTLDDFKHKR